MFLRDKRDKEIKVESNEIREQLVQQRRIDINIEQLVGAGMVVN